MKHIRTVFIPESTKTITDFIICDFCKKKIDQNSYEVDEVTLKYKTGEEYPECGSGTLFSVDMCGDCFEGKLIPWIESQGVKVQEEYWSNDW